MTQPNLLTPNSTVSLSQHSRKLIAKHNIAEFDLAFDKVSKALPTLSTFARDKSLLEKLNESSTFNNNNNALGLTNQTVKAQINFGNGGCFPMHYDTDAKLDNRKVTAIVYLNEQYQTGHDGGELRVYPFPMSSSIDVEPKFNRLVLFSSAWCLHRVLPSVVDRLCFTIWMSGDGGMSDSNVGASDVTAGGGAVGNNVEDSCDFLLRKENRQLLTKLVYADEWIQSLQESHPDSLERDALVDTHIRDCLAIDRRLKDHLPEGYEEFQWKEWYSFFEGRNVDWF
ncbi:2OG-Fe(II) oxygenase superfamily-domain-containing protein [Obelidium mucronatum]|nr:2OG-Fe(II) oxygenase superfamily-domain-containing protein [Obelidium mucronatum]